MSHLTLTHPQRPDLSLPQGQSDNYGRTAVTDIAAPVEDNDRPPAVHTRGRENERQVTGLFTAGSDASTQGRQAVANFLDKLETRVDIKQGEGYDVADQQLSTSISGILPSMTWRFQSGRPFEVQYELSLQVGKGTNQTGALDRRFPIVNNGMDTMLEVDGIPLPGWRQYESTREVQTEVKPRFSRDTAQTNDIIIQSKAVQTITFRGTHTGPQAQRASDDAALDDLLATKEEVQCKTKIPGYTVPGFVTGYDSDFNADFGEEKHNYELQFTVGERRD